jgi:hypothetical protein
MISQFIDYSGQFFGSCREKSDQVGTLRDGIIPTYEIAPISDTGGSGDEEEIPHMSALA